MVGTEDHGLTCINVEMWTARCGLEIRAGAGRLPILAIFFVELAVFLASPPALFSWQRVVWLLLNMTQWMHGQLINWTAE
jgi:hypothetical protein